MNCQTKQGARRSLEYLATPQTRLPVVGESPMSGLHDPASPHLSVRGDATS